MHEASLMRGLIKKIEDLAQQQDARRVVSVHVWLGALSHMSPEHFREHFDQVSPGTIASGAQLQIDISENIYDPDAQDLVLRSIDIES